MSHPQQPGFPGYQPNPHSQGQNPPNGQQYQSGYPGGYGPPPKKKTGLWVAFAAGLVIVIALAITGFVAPGFFLSKDSNNSAGNPPASGDNPTPSSPAPGGEPNASMQDGVAVMQSFVDKLNQQDAAGAAALACPGSLDEVMQRGIDRATAGQAAITLGDPESLVANSVGAKTSGTVNGQPVPKDGFIGANNKGNGYCITSANIFGLINDE